MRPNLRPLLSQHENLNLHHPRGGQALYLQAPLLENYSRYLQRYADQLLEDGGEHAIVEAVEDLAEDGGIATRAPVEFDDLRRSGHPMVESDGRNIYDRAPRQHRLSEEELRAKARLRQLPPELIGWIWWHVMHKQEPPPHLR